MPGLLMALMVPTLLRMSKMDCSPDRGSTPWDAAASGLNTGISGASVMSKSIPADALKRPRLSLTAATRICHMALSFSNFISFFSGMDIYIYRVGIHVKRHKIIWLHIGRKNILIAAHYSLVEERMAHIATIDKEILQCIALAGSSGEPHKAVETHYRRVGRHRDKLRLGLLPKRSAIRRLSGAFINRWSSVSLWVIDSSTPGLTKAGRSNSLKTCPSSTVSFFRNLRRAGTLKNRFFTIMFDPGTPRFGFLCLYLGSAYHPVVYPQ